MRQVPEWYWFGKNPQYTFSQSTSHFISHNALCCSDLEIEKRWTKLLPHRYFAYLRFPLQLCPDRRLLYSISCHNICQKNQSLTLRGLWSHRRDQIAWHHYGSDPRGLIIIIIIIIIIVIIVHNTSDNFLVLL